MRGFRIEAKLKENLTDAIKRRPQDFPHTVTNMVRWGDAAVSQWTNLVKNTYRHRRQPGWWIRNYLGPSSNRIRWKFAEADPLAITVYHDGQGSKYDFGHIIENGRPQYDQKLALRTSRKVRINKKGHPYLRIPISQDGLSEPDVYARKIGERRAVSENAIRNIYSYQRVASPGSLTEFHQIDKLRRIHRTQVQWLTMSQTSQGWFYPPIQGFAYSQAVRDAVLQGRAKISSPDGHLNFNNSIGQAIARDLVNLAARGTSR